MDGRYQMSWSRDTKREASCALVVSAPLTKVLRFLSIYCILCSMINYAGFQLSMEME